MQESLAQNGCDLDALGTPSMVNFKTRSGLKGQASVVRLSPQSVTFEIYGPQVIIRASELLDEIEILADSKSIYSGKALITNVLNTGTAIACEASLSEPLPGFNSTQTFTPETLCRTGFRSFLSRWEKFYRVNHEYKVVVADLQSFLWNLRLWLQQVELRLQSGAPEDRARMESDIAQGLRGQVTSSLTSMFERFEEVANRIDPDLQSVHRAFGQRQLHPHLLPAPFIHRTYAKPLGYAGDYEMMNMIVRNGLEGGSLYAKLVNAYMLDQAPAHAVRNRVQFLCDRIAEETLRVSRQGRRAKIYSIACGPAREIENFIAQRSFADHAEFRLLDFNDETLAYTASRLDDTKKQHQRNTPIRVVKNSVQSLLKTSGKTVADDQKHDLIYCSGLYDYLNDRLIKALNSYLYDQLRPGGLLIVGNFANNNPIQKIMEHALEWFLIYRSCTDLVALAPKQARTDDCVVIAESSGTHFFLQARKPA